MFHTLLRRWLMVFTRSDQAVPSQETPVQRPPLPGVSSARRSPARAPRLAVEVSDLAGETLVHLRGEAGFLEVGILDAALLPLNARRAALVTFNLSELHFVSSLVMGVLVRFCHSAVRTGGRVRVTALRPEVREAIERAGLAVLLLEQDTTTVEAARARVENLVPLSA